MTTAASAAVAAGRLLKETTSRCPACLKPCPAEVWLEEGEPARVVLRRFCPDHGEASMCIASDARFYWLARGRSENATGCCGGSVGCASHSTEAGTLGRNAHARGNAPFETLSTCLALIEVVHSCDLQCPVCYADSPAGAGANVNAVPLPELLRRIQGVIDRKGKIEILQLSGGEPTLHPRFFELVQWVRDHPAIDYVLLNSNGVRLANEPDFAARLGALFPTGGLQVYLQFDGPQREGQHALRAADLRATRRRALDRCAAAKLPVTLAMTVIGETLPFVWDTIAFGLEQPHVHGVTFQPLVGSGRVPEPLQPSSAGPCETPRRSRRLNTADILLAAIEQSRGQLRVSDFTPLPCGDPNCAVIGYLVRANGRVRSISEFVDFSRLQDFLRDRLQYNLDDLVRCGCESEPLGQLLKDLELRGSSAFRILVKPFMDAWTWDQDRIDRCCTHVIRPDGRLDSFCRYYSGFPDAREAPV